MENILFLHIKILVLLIFGNFITEVASVSNSSTLELIIGGDVSFAGLNYFLKKNQKCFYNGSFQNIKNRLNADFKIVNLESPFGRLSSLPEKPEKGKIVHLLAEVKAVEALKYLGVDAVSVANNHFADFGEPSMKLTLAELWRNNIEPSGYSFGKDVKSEQEPIIFSKNGIRVGILSYCAIEGGCYETRKKVFVGPSIYKVKSAIRDIKKLRKRVDFVLVFLHWGEEYSTVTMKDQSSTADALSPYVDIIIGSHSHIPGEHFFTNKTLVVESLGNLLFPMYNTEHDAFQPGEGRGNKKKVKSIGKMMSKFRNPTTIAEVVKLTFDKNGLMHEKTMFAHFDIVMDKNKCLVVRENKQKSPWKQICGEEDKKCAGDSSCNTLKCTRRKKQGKTIDVNNK